MGSPLDERQRDVDPAQLAHRLGLHDGRCLLARTTQLALPLAVPMSGFDPGKVPLDIRGRDNFDNYVQWLISQGFPFHLRKSMLFGQARAVGLTVDYEVARRVLPEERAAHPHAERRFK